MDKNEFIERLQRTLAGGLGSYQVAENVRYYQDYIDSEIRKGSTEEEVLSKLGDPRLLAKSIIEANKHAGESYGSNQGYDEEVADESAGRSGYGRTSEHRIMLPGWLVMVIVTVVAVLIIGIATSLISFFAPVILVGLVILLIVKIIQGSTK